MDFAYRFRLNPTPEQKERLAWTLDTCRQVYNHFLHRLNRNDDIVLKLSSGSDYRNFAGIYCNLVGEISARSI